MAEELSQDEIDGLFSDSQEKGKPQGEIEEVVHKLFELLNDSIEEVLKTAFSLEVVSKFTGLSISERGEVSVENKVFLMVGLSSPDNSAELYVLIQERFASILSDLMLMGPGEAKDKLEVDDLDALKELFSQVFGNLSTALKDSVSVPISIEVKDIKQGAPKLPDQFYRANYDVALPTIEDGVLEVLVEKKMVDLLFAVEGAKELEEEVEKPPFEDVEKIQEITPESREERRDEYIEVPKNLDIIMDIDLEVKIRIGEKYMLIKDILDLKDGSIIELDKSIEEPMDILVNDKVVAKGVVVVVGGKFGIKITHIETREERIKSLGG